MSLVSLLISLMLPCWLKVLHYLKKSDWPLLFYFTYFIFIFYCILYVFCILFCNRLKWCCKALCSENRIKSDTCYCNLAILQTHNCIMFKNSRGGLTHFNKAALCDEDKFTQSTLASTYIHLSSSLNAETHFHGWLHTIAAHAHAHTHTHTHST